MHFFQQISSDSGIPSGTSLARISPKIPPRSFLQNFLRNLPEIPTGFLPELFSGLLEKFSRDFCRSSSRVYVEVLFGISIGAHPRLLFKVFSELLLVFFRGFYGFSLWISLKVSLRASGDYNS